MKGNIPFVCFIGVVLLFAAGCTPMRYSRYTGQKKNWTVASGAMAETQYKVPVYRGWPDRPYNVIGSIRFVDPNKYWDDGVINMACAMAKEKGGDAIIIRSGAEFGVGMITGAARDPQVSYVNDTSALVIKWKSEQEVAAEKAALARLVSGFERKHPDVKARPELIDLATEYVHALGLKMDSNQASQTFDQVLNGVLEQPRDGHSLWLFRGAMRAGGITSSWSDVVYGIAKVARTGNNLTVVSESGNGDLTFSGTVQEGRVSGQLGFSSGATVLSSKADGVFTDEKMSLTGQGQTPDGTFFVSFALSR